MDPEDPAVPGLLRDGRIVQEGTLDDFRDRPAEPFVAEFMNAQRPAVAI